MKKMMAISVASAMLLTMGTAAAADIQMGLVSEEKLSWPQDFGFGQQLVVLRGEEAIEQEMDKAMELQPQDEIYIPLYYTTAEGESITVGASKEQMSGHVPYTGEIDKNWKLNLVDRSKQLIEDAQFYRASSKDPGLVKGAMYIKATTVPTYNSLEELEFELGVYLSERYSKNKTEQLSLNGRLSNPKSEKPVDFEWENNVFEKAVWEVAEEEDGTATFNFGDDAYYTVRMFGGDKVMLEFDRTYDKELADRYAEDLYFYNFRGDLDTFSATGTLTIPVEQPMYLYQVVKGELEAVDAVYNEEEQAMQLKTKSLGNYVLTEEKLEILRDADAIFREEMALAGLDRTTSQYFAVLTSVRSVGVMGDERTYDYAVALRAVTTTDFMTAESYDMPWSVLGTVTSRIVNEVKHVNRVFYDCTGKPPATIELE